MGSALPGMLASVHREMKEFLTLAGEQQQQLAIARQRRAELDESFREFTERWRRNVAASEAALARSLAALSPPPGESVDG